ncbi:hypothetical protein C8N35_1079 [Breoghania corrubedonensis]|uniref:Uncharacterized protein n=1 Tax=Breoghania corrubedonensis TaxID=665038 RepID=A0A2T5V6E7_9HYPH|nr:hypothetical protein C8N35_1079 [Breoghania corrubedonensis]
MKSMPARRFTIGQAVRMNNRFGLSPSTAETYRITAILPAREDNSPQYRIRNDDERHERVTTEDSLDELPVPSAAGDAAPEEKEPDNG